MSQTALDALLQIDSPPLTLPSTAAPPSLRNDDEQSVSNCSLMDFNREQLPSQLSEDNADASFRLLQPDLSFIPCSQQLNLSTLLANIDGDEPSLIISTQQVEEILLNETELPAETIMEVAAPSSEMLQLSTIKQEGSDTAFESEMAKFQGENFDLPDLDIDFEHLDAVERSFISPNYSSMPSSSLTSCETLPHVAQEKQLNKPKTNQLPPPQGTQNHFASRPLQANRHMTRSISPTTPSCASDETPTNPLNYLTLDYSQSTGSSTSAVDFSMRISRQPSAIIAASSVSIETDVEQPLDFSLHTDDMEESECADRQMPPPPLMNFSATPRRAASNFVLPDAANHRSQAAATATVAAEVANDFSILQRDEISNNSATADTTMIPSAVKQLYDVIRHQYSDFAFVYALSAQLCQERVPMDCFVNLKMGLLLSLASIGLNPDRPPIPIVAIGSDTYMANYLLMEIGQLADRFVGPTDDVRPPSSAGYRNHNWIDADPIILARGGVFYVGDWSRLKLTRAEKIFKDVECSRVAIERSPDYPLETAIWTHWRSFKYNAKDQQTFNKFVKIFGIPLHMDDDNQEVLVNYILEQASVRIFESTVDHLSISNDDMRSFLAVISKRTVDLTPEAALMLRKYFVAARMERPDCLTKQGFVVLKQFAESFAKLSFRHEVLPIDVVAAIYMCENCMQSMFGTSENPPPKFESHNFVGLVDGYMAQFQQWLEAYIAKHYDKE